MSGFLSSGIVNADTIPDSVVDDFEDQNVSEYASDTGDASFQTSFVKKGTYALEMSITDPASGIASTSGLESYPAQDERFRVWVRSDDIANAEPIVGWAVQSDTSASGNDLRNGQGYDVWLRSDIVYLERGDGSSTTQLDGASLTAHSDTWYQFSIDWLSDGSISVDVLDEVGTVLASVSATDTTYSSGGIKIGGNQAAANGTIYFDYYRVREQI